MTPKCKLLLHPLATKYTVLCALGWVLGIKYTVGVYSSNLRPLRVLAEVYTKWVKNTHPKLYTPTNLRTALRKPATNGGFWVYLKCILGTCIAIVEGKMRAKPTIAQTNPRGEIGDISTFPEGTIARDNQSDETFTLDRQVGAVRENKNAFRIRGQLLQGPRSFDAHWIYLSDNDEKLIDIRTEGLFEHQV